MTEFSNWGLTDFWMGLSVMAATKLADACFLYCFFRVLYFWGGGICGGGPSYNLGGVIGSSGIVWTAGGEIILGCDRVGSCWGDIS